MGMLMVAEGLGLTVLPDYSVVGDPLRRAGLITHRPITGDATAVSLILLQRQLDHAPSPYATCGKRSCGMRCDTPTHESGRARVVPAW